MSRDLSIFRYLGSILAFAAIILCAIFRFYSSIILESSFFFKKCKLPAVLFGALNIGKAKPPGSYLENGFTFF
jgi:hypothetical protein